MFDFTDRQKLAHSSLKQFGGLTVTPIQEPVSKTRMHPKGKSPSTGWYGKLKGHNYFKKKYYLIHSFTL